MHLNTNNLIDGLVFIDQTVFILISHFKKAVHLDLSGRNVQLLVESRADIYRFPLIYGTPTAFGASARPTTPASARIVKTYGAIKR